MEQRALSVPEEMMMMKAILTDSPPLQTPA
jgi:hypothetical protein